VAVEEEETETSRTTWRVPKADPLEPPEAAVDVEMEKSVPPELMTVNAETAKEKVTSLRTAPSPRKSVPPERNVRVAEAEVETASPEKKEITSAATATRKVTSPEIAPSPRRSVPPERNVRVAEAEVETASPEKKATTNAVTATRKVTSPEIAPNPRKREPRDLDATSLPVPPLVRPAETAMRKVTLPETAPLPRRRELPVSKDPPESPGHATTAVKKDISPETAPKPRPLLKEKSPRKVSKLDPKESCTPLRVRTTRRVSTEKITPLGKPERLLRVNLSSRLSPPFRLPRRPTPLVTRSVRLPMSTTSRPPT